MKIQDISSNSNSKLYYSDHFPMVANDAIPTAWFYSILNKNKPDFATIIVLHELLRLSRGKGDNNSVTCSYDYFRFKFNLSSLQLDKSLLVLRMLRLIEHDIHNANRFKKFPPSVLVKLNHSNVSKLKDVGFVAMANQYRRSTNY